MDDQNMDGQDIAEAAFSTPLSKELSEALDELIKRLREGVSTNLEHL